MLSTRILIRLGTCLMRTCCGSWGLDQRAWGGAARGGASWDGRGALHPGAWRAAVARFEDGGERDDPGIGEAVVAAAGGGDDGARERGAGGFESDRAGGSVSGAESGIQADAGADCRPDRGFARDGVELHAVVAAAAESDGLPAFGSPQLQRCAGDFAAGE